MLELTPEEQQAVDSAEEDPIRLTDVRTQREYVLISVEVYDQLRKQARLEEIDPSLYEFEDPAS